MLRLAHRLGALAGFLGFFLLGLWWLASQWQMRDSGLAGGELEFASTSPGKGAQNWIIAPTEVGSDLPPKGASLFDRLFTKLEDGKAVYDIPYPFEKVVARLEAAVGRPMDPLRPAGPKGLLIPLGRSLQRNAAVSDDTNVKDLNPYFQFPRVVVGLDEDAPAAPGVLREHLRDRFFIGFHEKAQVLEVVSYNEDAGRFEFQIVRDYNERGEAKVFYAQRSLCLSCHQNQSPIFAKQPWNEMNAHQVLIDRLNANLKTDASRPGYYHGVPVRIGLTTPYAFDNSTDRANFIIPTQRLWRRMCASTECRAQVLLAALLRTVAKPLNLAVEIDRPFVDQIAQAFRAEFPDGMWIPNPDLLNRDPLTDIRGANAAVEDLLKGRREEKTELSSLLRRSLVSAEFEPLQARAPLEVWRDLSLNPGGQMDRFLAGIADQFTSTDFREVDSLIFGFTKTDDEEILRCSWEILEGKISGRKFSLDGVCASANFEVGVYLEVVDGQVTRGEAGELKVKDALCPRVSRAFVEGAGGGAGKACLTYTSKKLTARVERTADVLKVRIGFWDKDGLHLRTPRGNAFLNLDSEIPLAAEDRAEVAGKGGVGRDWDRFKTWMSPFLAKNQDLLGSPVVPRFELMSRLLAETQRLQGDTRSLRVLQNQLERHVERPVDGLPPDFRQSALREFITSCAVCHRNAEGVPPNFLGGPHLSLSTPQLCERIARCAPRMLYRLKMRNCAEPEQKLRRSPMPPSHAFFGFLNDDEETWMKTKLPGLTAQLSRMIETESLTRSIAAKGVPAAEAAEMVRDLVANPCPAMKGTDYQRLLPACEFSELPSPDACLELMR